MDVVSSSSQARRTSLQVIAIAALPTLLVLWDLATRADLMVRLLTMPPVSAIVLGIVVVAALQGSASHRFDLVTRLKSTGTRARRRGLIILALFAWAAAGTVVIGVRPQFGLIKLGELGLIALTTLALVIAIAPSSEGRDRAIGLVWALTGGIAVATLLVLVIAVAGLNAHAPALAVPGFVHIRILGFSLALGLAAAAGLWTKEKAPRRQYLALLPIMTILWTALIWSGGRGALAALVATVVILGGVLPAFRRAILPLLATAVAGALLATLIGSGPADFGLTSRMADLSQATDADTLTSGRVEMWRALIAASVDAPLFGRGYAQSHWVFVETGLPVRHLHGHNIILDGALWLGWPMAVVLAALTLTSWFGWLAQIRQTPDSVLIAAIAVFTTFLAHAMVDGIYFYQQGLIPLAVALAVLISLDGASKTSRQAPPGTGDMVPPHGLEPRTY